MPLISKPSKDPKAKSLEGVVDNKIKTEGAKVRVLETDEKWYGVTYREDKDMVVEAMKEKIKDGCYNEL